MRAKGRNHALPHRPARPQSTHAVESVALLADGTTSLAAGGVTAPSFWRPQECMSPAGYWTKRSSGCIAWRPRRAPIDGTPALVVIPGLSRGQVFAKSFDAASSRGPGSAMASALQDRVRSHEVAPAKSRCQWSMFPPKSVFRTFRGPPNCDALPAKLCPIG